MKQAYFRAVLFIRTALLTCFTSPALLASPIENEQRAKFNYQMHCQGCHVHDGRGGNSIPNMQGQIGRFLLSQQGREYLVQVPGSANSVLPNDELAEVLNWILINYAGKSLPANWRAYQADEVALYRNSPLFEVAKYRQNLLKKLSAEHGHIGEK